MSQSLVRVDLHCHTTASPDGGLTEHDIAQALTSGRLDVIAVTDHNQIAEAQRLHEQFGEAIIVGEEVMTTDGEIIGLYLTEQIPAGLTPLETVRAIKDQGGLVAVPHPFETVRSGISLEGLNAIAEHVDMIEIINGRSFSRRAQRQARIWATEHSVPGIASSDAHGRIGWTKVYTALHTHPTKETLAALCASATYSGTSNGYYSYLYPKLNRLIKRYR